MADHQTVLIVDDNEINRKILIKLLSADYKIMEAADGREAIETLDRCRNAVSAVMLDLLMPGMNGYEFLEAFSKREGCQNIPVIVSTGQTGKNNEIEALRLGAWDFITKPYVAEIIRFRLKNAILRSQLTAFQELKYKSEYDVLTGIYNKDRFFSATREMLLENPDEKFTFVRFDIERFHLVNSYFGQRTGDEVLKYIAAQLKNHVQFLNAKMTYGRIEGDTFAACVSITDKARIERGIKACKLALKNYEIPFDMVPAFGMYVIEDPELPVNEMFDRANLAVKSAKGKYMENHCYYTEAMGSSIAQEQEIINDMGAAIAEEQFEVWYQPKYDIRSDLPMGAEALVRWRHPRKGLLAPGYFISVFEHNGLISKLDRYVWEHLCMDLHGWIEAGKHPQPVSVNVSRVDLMDSHLIDVIIALTEKYQIPHAMLNLELTESAYADNPERVIKMMKEFQENGFVILMDDFGSGYSSLSVLKDIDVNILKIDMRFFSKGDVERRGRSIIASVVRMAKWLRIPMVAEGVETLEQVEFLREIGCEYVQGYYYAKPMPRDEYELFLDGNAAIPPAHREEASDSMKIWEMNTLLADIAQAAAIFEQNDGDMEIIRVNRAFYDLFGFDRWEDRFQNPTHYVAEECKKDYIAAFEKAALTETSAEVDYLRKAVGKPPMWVRMRLKNIGRVDHRILLYGIFSDITAQKKLDEVLSAAPPAPAGTQKNVDALMIVADSEEDRSLLTTIFSGQCTVMQARNSGEALEMLKSADGKVDAVLMDAAAPGAEERGFLQDMQRDERLLHIPAVFIAADASPERQAEMMRLGAGDYILKPFVTEVLVQRVKNAIGGYQGFSKNSLDKTDPGE